MLRGRLKTLYPPPNIVQRFDETDATGHSGRWGRVFGALAFFRAGDASAALTKMRASEIGESAPNLKAN